MKRAERLSLDRANLQKTSAELYLLRTHGYPVNRIREMERLVLFYLDELWFTQQKMKR